MKPSDKQSGDLLQDEALKAQLRSLPKATVPAGLRGKLLAAVPDTLPARKPSRLKYYIWAGGATAAAVVLLAVSVTDQPPVQAPQPTAPVMTEAEIRRTVDREVASARLLATADILELYPTGREDAAQLREYIAGTFADTSAARQIGDMGLDQQGEMQ